MLVITAYLLGIDQTQLQLWLSFQTLLTSFYHLLRSLARRPCRYYVQPVSAGPVPCITRARARFILRSAWPIPIFIQFGYSTRCSPLSLGNIYTSFVNMHLFLVVWFANAFNNIPNVCTFASCDTYLQQFMSSARSIFSTHIIIRKIVYTISSFLNIRVHIVKPRPHLNVPLKNTLVWTTGHGKNNSALNIFLNTYPLGKKLLFS